MGEGGGGLGGGGGGSLGGSGAPISPGSGAGGSASGGPKLPNAISPTPGAAASAGAAAGDAKPKIHGFSSGNIKKHAENWKRKTNLTGTGATHMRTFHCKLNSESVEYMDQQINEWLDNHPDYEVKMVTTAIGEWTGKIKEPAMVVTVWV
jgi:hypothetical protein